MMSSPESSFPARRSRRIAGLNPASSSSAAGDHNPDAADSAPLQLQEGDEGNVSSSSSSSSPPIQDLPERADAGEHRSAFNDLQHARLDTPPGHMAGHGDISGSLFCLNVTRPQPSSSETSSTSSRHHRNRDAMRHHRRSHLFSRTRSQLPSLRITLGGGDSLRNTYTEPVSSEAVPVRGESFCTCTQLSQRRELQCSCGEEDTAFEWTWDAASASSACDLTDDQREVHFHVNYSSGTAAVRGSHGMTDRQHFWEIKMTTPVYGTDMMVGVGTKAADLDAYRYSFCSLLGRDGDSWGLSYYGRLHHKGNFTQLQGSRFGQGSIVGVHLDMWRGILSFYKNRRPLGIGYTGLSGKVLYPMVSSTAARTGMRLIKACSFQTSLQFLCCQVLREIIPAHLDVMDVLKLPPGLHAFLTNNLGWLLRPNELSDPVSDSPPASGSLLRKRSWSRRFTFEPTEGSSSSDEEEEASLRCPVRHKRRRKETQGYLKGEGARASDCGSANSSCQNRMRLHHNEEYEEEEEEDGDGEVSSSEESSMAVSFGLNDAPSDDLEPCPGSSQTRS